MLRDLKPALIAAGALLLMHGARADDPAWAVGHYRHLHEHPELSLQEEHTANYLATELGRLGYTVTRNVGGHGFVATLANGAGPTLLYRADMDALPIEERTGLPYASTVVATDAEGKALPVMHACGHDVHMATLLGVARRMARNRDDWQGTLLLVLEAAEEIGAGARLLLEGGLYERFPLPDYNLALHVSADLPAGTIGLVSGYAMANVDSVDITVHGVGGHGAYPHNTLDPIVIAAQIVTGLQTIVSRGLSPLDSAVVTIGAIHGGSKHNIIPDEVTLQLTVRSYADETRAFILARIREISHGIAASAGVPGEKLPTVTVRDEYTPAVFNNPAFMKTIEAALAEIVGPDRIAIVDPVMAGEDFSRYGRTVHAIPGALLWLGAVDPAVYREAKADQETLPGLHSARFAPAAETTLATGIDAMSALLQALFRKTGRP